MGVVKQAAIRIKLHISHQKLSSETVLVALLKNKLCKINLSGLPYIFNPARQNLRLCFVNQIEYSLQVTGTFKLNY
jgi:hypothetical protein